MTRFDHILQQIRRHELNAPATIRFGSGCVTELPGLAQTLAPEAPVLLLCDASAVSSGLLDRTHRALADAGSPVVDYTDLRGEPTAESVNRAAAAAREHPPGLVVGLGGGSIVDTAKAVAALTVNDGPVEDYLEGVGTGRTLEHPPLPCLAVPTTAGTGAEMTKNAVVGDYDRQYKKSMRDERMIPTAAIVDPELTLTVPVAATAAGGMDAITQLIEPCISTQRRPDTTALALEILPGCREALLCVHRDLRNLPAREQLALASMTSGVCLANAGLGLAHGIASGMGAICRVAHGLICGILLPHVLRWNRESCERELAEALAAFLGENRAVADTVDRGLDAIQALNRDLGLPPDFKYLNLDHSTVTLIAEHSQGSSMSKNPRPMDEASTLAFLTPLM